VQVCAHRVCERERERERDRQREREREREQNNKIEKSSGEKRNLHDVGGERTDIHIITSLIWFSYVHTQTDQHIYGTCWLRVECLA